MEILIKDGVKYSPTDFQGKESEFEEIVFTQYKHLFGDNTILFTKHKIKTATDIGTIPDAFAIDFEKEKWFIIEIEISNHDVYTHIVPQLTKFSSALNNSQTRKKLIRFFDEEIKKDPFKNALLIANGKNEVFKTVSEIVDSSPELIIIIEQQHEELRSIFNSLPFKTKITVFKTYTRYGLDLGDNIFQIEPLSPQKQKKIEQTKVKEKKDIQVQLHEAIDIGDVPDYVRKFASGLDNETTVIYRMLDYINAHQPVTYGKLKKVCVTEFGCKNEQSGSISGSIGALIWLGKIIVNGRGNEKKISIKP